MSAPVKLFIPTNPSLLEFWPASYSVPESGAIVCTTVHYDECLYGSPTKQKCPGLCEGLSTLGPRSPRHWRSQSNGGGVIPRPGQHYPQDFLSCLKLAPLLPVRSVEVLPYRSPITAHTKPQGLCTKYPCFFSASNCLSVSVRPSPLSLPCGTPVFSGMGQAKPRPNDSPLPYSLPRTLCLLIWSPSTKWICCGCKSFGPLEGKWTCQGGKWNLAE